jgi:hypothetical protein
MASLPDTEEVAEPCRPLHVMVKRCASHAVAAVPDLTLPLRDLRSRSFGRFVVSPLRVCNWSAPRASTQHTPPALQRVSEPLDIAYGGRVHFRHRPAENEVTSVARAVDGPAVHAHTSRQEHLIIFQALVP